MEQLNARMTRIEYAVVLWPDVPPEPPFYDTCQEAQAIVLMAGGGMVMQRAYYETDWLTHEPHT